MVNKYLFAKDNKKSLKKVLILLVLTSLFASCTQNVTVDESNEVQDVIYACSQKIYLGEKVENPFSVKNESERAASSGSSANYYYFKCRSENSDNYMWLYENFGDLEFIPTDQKIVSVEDSDNGNVTDPWVYFTLPISEYQKIVSYGGFETLILDELYYPSESNSRSILEKFGFEVKDMAGQLQFESLLNSKSSVANKSFSNMKVIISHNDSIESFAFDLDSAGMFSGKFIGKNTESGFYRVKLCAPNENYDVKTIKGFSDLFSKSYLVGDYTPSKLKNFKYTAKPGTLLNTVGVAYFTLRQFDATVESLGLSVPKKLTVYLCDSDDNSGCCLLINSTVVDFKKNGQKEFAITPDIIINYLLNANTGNMQAALKTVLFHELSHASHFFGLEERWGHEYASNYWKQEYNDMLYAWSQTFMNKIFAGGNISEAVDEIMNNCYANGTPLISLIESWGYYSEWYIDKNYILRSRYENPGLYLTLKPDTWLGKNSSFYDLGFYKLTSEEGAVYELDVTYKQIYNALTCKNVVDLHSFCDALYEYKKEKADAEKFLIRYTAE